MAGEAQVDCLMITPTKGVDADRALLTIGALALDILASGPLTINQTWSRLQSSRGHSYKEPSPLSFDWFTLALDMLFALGTLTFNGSTLGRTDVGNPHHA